MATRLPCFTPNVVFIRTLSVTQVKSQGCNTGREPQIQDVVVKIEVLNP